MFGLIFLLGYLTSLPARASKQGNVIGLVSVYINRKFVLVGDTARANPTATALSDINIYIYIVVIKIFFVIERTRDLIYLKFVETDFFQKIISPNAGENSGDIA